MGKGKRFTLERRKRYNLKTKNKARTTMGSQTQVRKICPLGPEDIHLLSLTSGKGENIMEERISRREFLNVSATTGAILASGKSLLPILPNTVLANEPKLCDNEKRPFMKIDFHAHAFPEAFCLASVHRMLQ